MPPIPPDWQAFFTNLANASTFITIVMIVYGILTFIISVFAYVVLVRFLLLAWRWMSTHEARATLTEGGGLEALARQMPRWIQREGDRLPTADEYIARLANRRRYRWDIILATVYIAILAVIIIPTLYLAQQPGMATVAIVLAILIIAILLIAAAL
jgi:hypothetical protein